MKINIEFDTNLDSQQTIDSILSNFKIAFKGAQEVIEASQPKVINTATTGAQKKAVATKVVKEVITKTINAEELPKSKGSVSLDDIRPVMSSKLSAHKESIRAWMDEISAPMLSDIPEEKYEAFLTFLKGL